MVKESVTAPFSPPMMKTGSPQVYPSAAGEALDVSSLSVILVPAGKVPRKVTASPSVTFMVAEPVLLSGFSVPGASHPW